MHLVEAKHDFATTSTKWFTYFCIDSEVSDAMGISLSDSIEDVRLLRLPTVPLQQKWSKVL